MYTVFVAANIKQIVDYYWIEIDIKLHMLILLVPLIMILCIKNLKFLAPFSTFANGIMFVGIGLILYYVFDGISSPSERDAVGVLRNYPLFFCTTLFSLTSVGVVMAVEGNMKTPKSFGGRFGVLNISMAFIVVMYLVMGFFGYLKYGADCEGSITLNLPQNDL